MKWHPMVGDVSSVDYIIVVQDRDQREKSFLKTELKNLIPDMSIHELQ
jgi:hypothetical protein